MRRVVVAALSCWVGCAVSAQKDEVAVSERGKPASDQISEPVMVTQVVSVKAPAKLSYVHGTCYIVRDQAASQTLRVGATLRDGDVIELGDNCIMKIHSSGISDIVLRRENGRFFKLEIKQ